jgi:hypothetical protein
MSAYDGALADEDGVHYLDRIATALERQATVMEKDIESEIKEIDEQSVVAKIHQLGDELDGILTYAHYSNFDKAKALRAFQQKLAEFDISSE